MSVDVRDFRTCLCCEYGTADWKKCESCGDVYCGGCAKYELKEVNDERLCEMCRKEAQANLIMEN